MLYISVGFRGKEPFMGISALHRKCLQNGSLGGPNGENEAQLYTGDKVRQECIDQGWLERLPDSPAGFRMYRTTELGRAVFNAPVAKRPLSDRG
jgi:hypothetical protein